MLPSLIDGILHVSPYHSRKSNCTIIISGLTSKYISVTLTTDKDGFFQQDQESYCCIYLCLNKTLALHDILRQRPKKLFKVSVLLIETRQNLAQWMIEK